MTVETPTATSEVVYLIGSPGNTRVKIGRSIDAQGRLANIQRMSPLSLEILWTHPGGAGLETHLHRHFKDRRVHGEWFEFASTEEAKALVAAAVDAPLPPDRKGPDSSAQERAERRRERSEIEKRARATAAQEVTAAATGRGLPLTTAHVARLLGVKDATLRLYRTHSRPGGRYGTHPFPEPDGHLGAMPYWKPESVPQILEWAATRIGKGVGGGRPRREAIPE